jgi:hypothetical protein
MRGHTTVKKKKLQSMFKYRNSIVAYLIDVFISVMLWSQACFAVFHSYMHKSFTRQTEWP